MAKTDVNDNEVQVGDSVVIAVGLSGSSASAARLRFGQVREIEPRFVVFWKDTQKESQPMSFYSRRVMVLS